MVTSFWGDFYGASTDKKGAVLRREVPHRIHYRAQKDPKWDGGEPDGVPEKSLNI